MITVNELNATRQSYNINLAVTRNSFSARHTGKSNSCNDTCKRGLYAYAMSELIGDRIRRLLEIKNGGNQSELARAAQVTPQAVQQWIAHETSPRGKNLDRAAAFLGVTPAELRFGQLPAAPAHPDRSVQEMLDMLQKVRHDELLLVMAKLGGYIDGVVSTRENRPDITEGKDANFQERRSRSRNII